MARLPPAIEEIVESHGQVMTFETLGSIPCGRTRKREIFEILNPES